MQPKDFKYYLRKKLTPSSYVYYYVNSTGAVTTTGTATELNFAPEGWDEKALKWERGFDWWGVFTNMTLPLRFVRDGKEIVRYVYYTEGVDGNCELYIERLDRSTMTYSLYFRGELDFSKIDNQENTYTVIPVMDGDYMSKLKAEETTEYQIDLDTNPDYFYVYLDGIRVDNEVQYYPTIGYNINAGGPSTVPMTRLFEESRIGIQSFIQEVVVKSYAPAAATSYRLDYENCLVNNKVGTVMEVDISWDFVYSIFSLPTSATYGNFSILIDHCDSNGIGLSSTNIVPPTNPLTIFNTLQSVSGSTTFNLSFGDRLYIISFMGGTPGSAYGIEYQPNGLITLDVNFRILPTYVKALHPKKVFDGLVNNISGGEVTTSSTVLTSNYASNGGKDFAITTGDSIRGLAGKLKTTFNDFFTSYNSILNLATWYDKSTKIHHIEDKSEVFRNSASMVISGANDVSFKPLTEQLLNGFYIGYPEIKIEGLNGREAFNCKFEFSTPIKRVQNKKDMTSKYIADPFTIEIHRANLEGKTTTDSDEDNNIFLLHIKSTPSGTYLGKDYYQLERLAYSSISGLSHPAEMFNIELSPKRSLLRNGSLLRSLLHLADSDYIKFQSSDRNQDLETTLGAVTITENADVLISTLGTPLFIPIVAEFTCPVPIDIQTLLDTDPYGKITFPYNGITVEGYLLEASETPARRSSQQIKLLLTSNNTITDLI